MDIGRMASYLLKYMIPGIVTFIVDLTLLWILMEYADWHYLPAAMLAFSVGTTMNYFFAHKWVFKGTQRDFHMGYVYFMILSLVGIILTAGIMAIFVEVVRVHPFPARVIVALIVGGWNFGMNYFLNFKMHHHFDIKETQTKDDKGLHN